MSTRCSIHYGEYVHIYFEITDGLYHCEIGSGNSFINFIMDKYIAEMLVNEMGGEWTNELEGIDNGTKSN